MVSRVLSCPPWRLAVEVKQPAGLPATKGELAQLLEHLIAELDAIDFFRTPDRRESMARTLKAIFARADLHAPDAHLLRGVIKDLARGGRRRDL